MFFLTRNVSVEPAFSLAQVKTHKQEHREVPRECASQPASQSESAAGHMITVGTYAEMKDKTIQRSRDETTTQHDLDYSI